MAAKRKERDVLASLSTFSEQMTDRDKEVSVRRAEDRGELSTILIDRIQLRETDTRPLNQKHVASLMESIAALGLIEPLVVDSDKVLLAGGHRLAAITLLQEHDIDSFNKHFSNGKIPIRTMPFKSAEEPERALQIEVAENEHRRDYTPAEVRNIADYLREVGYKDSQGRPKKGEKALLPALSVVIGKNIRTIQRYLKDEPKKNTTDVVFFLKKAKRSLESWNDGVKRTRSNKELREKVSEVLSLIEIELEKSKTK